MTRTHLAKVGHLPIVRKSTKHVHPRDTHAKHVVSAKATVRIPVEISLLLLLLLLSESIDSIWTNLRRHAVTIAVGVYGERGGRIEGAASKTTGRSGGITKARLGYVGLWTIAVVGKYITRGIRDVGAVRTRERRSGRPARLFSIRTTHCIHGPLIKKKIHKKDSWKGEIANLHHIDIRRSEIRIWACEGGLRVVHRSGME